MNFLLKSLLLISASHFSCKTTPPTPSQPFQISSIKIDGKEPKNATVFDVKISPEIQLSFSSKINISTAKDAVLISNSKTKENIISDIKLGSNDSTLVISPQKLTYLNSYNLQVLQTLKSSEKQTLNSEIQMQFSTSIDSTDKFPRISDEELLTLVQKQTFKYFWDFGHPVSGLARERNSSGDVITSGGSGFGIMTIPVAINRGFINREEGLDRMLKIVDFLQNKAIAYHGVFPHWLNGATGATIPFSPKDNGADLVETSYLMAGLLTTRQYFSQEIEKEINLRKGITELWEAVDWNWHTQNQDVLYWHWSPTFAWEMNHQIHGWNEALITYIMAAASPTHPIKKSVYDAGWARNGDMKNGKSFYGIKLPLGEDLGGPLFFEQYTFLGIDPRKLKDQYANYWEQAVNHTQINRAYCVQNPKNYVGYSSDCWGLTASDNNTGYSAHSPTNDLGVITPTAALSSFPFTPKESMEAMRFFYYKLGDKIWKQHGFVDSFNLSKAWYADSFLAIDQGPIVLMIENHRSGLLWKLLMADKDIKTGLDKLGFEY
ncbi:beta-glucosidase [Lacihabitans sp. LS3-19]|uniref:glucoamylase family protein n=1 Tax=Lacihabitans sp. LS3-19 TaxID=2487335 RepID=UPI0020CE0204|nr:glucoamylase family protein [Lacihabitans sp. LS3-19]MCP9768311.1 beta-glucosidase [Lacihabitans sp. LS3-19]